MSGTYLLRLARADTECDVCGQPVPKGSEFALLSGAMNRRGALVPDTKFCGLCSAMYMVEPTNLHQFYETPSDPSAAECLGIIDCALCDAGCIISGSDRDECDCRCNGRLHGALRRSIEREITAAQPERSAHR